MMNGSRLGCTRICLGSRAHVHRCSFGASKPVVSWPLSTQPTRLYTSQGNSLDQHTDRHSDLLSKPTWSVKSLLESHDHIQKNNKATGDQEAEITPETINQLLTLAHLHKPEDPQELERLQRDLKNMRNFLKSIQSHGTDQQGDSTRPLKSLVDDGHGLAMRPTQLSTEEEKVDEEANTDANRSRRRDTLLKRAQMVKGNFFVVETVLDPEKDN